MNKVKEGGTSNDNEQNGTVISMEPLTLTTFDESERTTETPLIFKPELPPSSDPSSPTDASNDEVHVITSTSLEKDVEQPVMDPAMEWKRKQDEKNKMKLNQALVEKIVTGCKLRQVLASPENKVLIDELLISYVKSGNICEVKGIYNLLKRGDYPQEDYRVRDRKGRSLMEIAVDNRDAEMVKLLLTDEILKQTIIPVGIGYSLYRAIQHNFLEGVKLLLPHERKLTITSVNSEFLLYTTPQILAAYHDRYEILLFLKKSRLEIKIEKPTILQDMHSAWETSHHLQMISRARSSPAYIMALSEDNSFDTFDYCIELIKELRNLTKIEHEFSDFYQKLVEGVESFMCKLLDQIRSSLELAHIFEYEYSNDITRVETLKYIHQTTMVGESGDGVEETGIGIRLGILEESCAAQLLNFVTHHNSQLAIEHLTYRNTPIFRTGNNLSFYVTRILLALLFPILCIFHVVAPKSKLGRLITYPCTSYDCRIMSEFCFVIFLIANISCKREALEYLGSPPSVFESLIGVWVLGKCLQEIQELHKRGYSSYINDPWNHSDIWAIVCFTIAFCFRIIDYVKYYQVPYAQLPARAQWNMFEWRLLAEGFMAFAYLFVFIRLLGLTRVHRSLGPLQVSLARMVIDVVRFLFIFGFILFAFALALAELYWFYGTGKGKEIFCDPPLSNNTAAPCVKGNPPFQGVWNSLYDLFWALFGQINLDNLSLSGKHVFTEYVAKVILGIYHMVAIIVLLNMLIAMMSKSYERTSENEEKEWKLQRTKMWIRILRKEIIRPPPMNLLPPLWDIAMALRGLFHLWKLRLLHCRIFFNARGGSRYIAWNYRKARTMLVSRYKEKYLLSDENLLNID